MRGDWDELERRHGASLEGPGKFVALGVVVTLAFLAWTQFFGKERNAVTPAPALEAAVVQSPVIEPPQVIERPAPHYQGPSVGGSGRDRYMGVYECEVNGHRVVSDRPCAPGAQVRTLVIDQPDSREVARQRQMTQLAVRAGSTYDAGPSGGSPSSNVGPTSDASNAVACEAVDRAIDQLNARMRQRYGAAEGERLRARWHNLKQQRHDLKCGR